MKKVILAVVLFFVLAVPAFAQGPQNGPQNAWQQVQASARQGLQTARQQVSRGQQTVTRFVQNESQLSQQETTRWAAQMERDLNKIGDGVGQLHEIKDAGGPLVYYACNASQGVLCAQPPQSK